MGRVISLRNSFNASAKGCGIPARPTLFGPFRSWTYPRILRSRRVKKAIARSAITAVRIRERNGEISIDVLSWCEGPYWCGLGGYANCGRPLKNCCQGKLLLHIKGLSLLHYSATLARFRTSAHFMIANHKFLIKLGSDSKWSV